MEKCLYFDIMMFNFTFIGEIIARSQLYCHMMREDTQNHGISVIGSPNFRKGVTEIYFSPQFRDHITEMT